MNQNLLRALRSWVFTGVASLVLVGSFAAIGTAQKSGPPPFTWVQVVPGVFATLEPREFALSPLVHGNSMFVVNDSDVFAVDANRTPAAARSTIALLQRATNKPVRNLMITHAHGDHVLGTQAFVEAFPGLNIISTDSGRTDIMRTIVESFAKRPPNYYTVVADRYDSLFNAGVSMAGRPLTPARSAMFTRVRDAFRNYYIVEAARLRLFPPTTTFQGKLTLRSGTREFELLSFRGDTRGDAVAWLPKERVVATGDVLVEPVPYSGSPFPTQWLATLRTIRALDPLHIVPGHGNVQHDTQYLDRVIGVLADALTEVRRAVAAGLTLEQTKQRVTLSEWRAKFTNGDAALQDRWDDFLDGLIENAFAEAKSGK